MAAVTKRLLAEPKQLQIEEQVVDNIRVQFFDETLGLDPKIRCMLNERVQELEQQFRY